MGEEVERLQDGWVRGGRMMALTVRISLAHQAAALECVCVCVLPTPIIGSHLSSTCYTAAGTLLACVRCGAVMI